jgi:hypothetical protein
MRSNGARAWLPACVAVLAMLVLPAVASARDTLDVKHGGVATEMSVQGSHGYEIRIGGGSEGRVGRVVVTAVNRAVGRGAVVASYEAPGRVTRSGVHANLGRLGRISVRFRRIGEPKVSRLPSARKCKGRDPIVERGRFEGTIRFRGEQGFTEVTTQGAKGKVARVFKRRCSGPDRKRGAGVAAMSREDLDSLGTALITGAEDQGRTVSFSIVSVATKPGVEEPFFLSIASAGTAERRGRISIERAAVVAIDRKNFPTSPLGVDPVTATVSLPKPFEGTASYLEETGSPPSWTGSLKVRLPGAEVPLTGPGFTAALCREKSVKKFDSCLTEATETVGVADTFARASAGLLP